MTRPAAVLWDLDGTLIDSESIWIQVEQDLVANYGGVWTHKQGIAQVGHHVSETALELQAAGVDLPVDRIIAVLTAGVLGKMAQPLWRPGAEALLTAVHQAGIPCALVTSSPRAIAEAVVRAAPAGAFTQVISGSDVVNPKPHPEPYLLAVELLHADAKRVVAIEDSVTGIASAQAAGLNVIAVPFMTPIEPDHVWRHWDTLVARNLSDLYL